MSRPSRVVIPVLDLEQNDKPLIKQVVKGCKELSVQKISSDSSSDNSCSFSFQPPSQNTIIDRRIEMELSVELAFANAVADNAFDNEGVAAVGLTDTLKNCGFERVQDRKSGKVLAPSAASFPVAAVVSPTTEEHNSGVSQSLSNNLAPRQFPISSIIDTIDLTINGTHFTASANQYIHALMTYTTPEYRDKVFGNNAYHHPDKSDYTTALGKIDNPLNKTGEGGRHGETPRGASFYEEIVKYTDNGGIANSGIRIALREPLLLSPLMMEFGHGMTNINDISVTINWKSDKKRCFSMIETSNALFKVANRTVPRELTNAKLVGKIASSVDPQLVVRYYTPQDDIKIPNEIVLPYKQPKVVIQSAVNIGLGTSHTFNSNNIRLNQIPEAVYIYAKRSRATETILTSDSYASIEQLNVSWKNKTGVLSGFRQSELLQTAQANGCDIQRSEVLQGGYVLKLVFGKDLPLDDNESGGTRGDYNWQCDVTVKNHQSARQFELFQVFVYNGHAIISPNECRVMTGILDLKDNVEAEDMGEDYHSNNTTGGSYVAGSIVGGSGEAGGSLLGGKAKHIASGVMKAVSMAKDLKPCAEGAMNAYSKYKTRA